MGVGIDDGIVATHAACRDPLVLKLLVVGVVVVGGSVVEAGDDVVEGSLVSHGDDRVVGSTQQRRATCARARGRGFAQGLLLVVPLFLSGDTNFTIYPTSCLARLLIYLLLLSYCFCA